MSVRQAGGVRWRCEARDGRVTRTAGAEAGAGAVPQLHQLRLTLCRLSGEVFLGPSSPNSRGEVDSEAAPRLAPGSPPESRPATPASFLVSAEALRGQAFEDSFLHFLMKTESGLSSTRSLSDHEMTGLWPRLDRGQGE